MALQSWVCLILISKVAWSPILSGELNQLSLLFWTTISVSSEWGVRFSQVLISRRVAGSLFKSVWLSEAVAPALLYIDRPWSQERESKKEGERVIVHAVSSTSFFISLFWPKCFFPFFLFLVFFYFIFYRKSVISLNEAIQLPQSDSFLGGSFSHTLLSLSLLFLHVYIGLLITWAQVTVT